MNILKNRFGRMAAFGAAVATLGLSRAQAAFLAYDAQTQAVTFDPGAAIGPVITAVVAAVLAGVSLFVIAVGVRWVYRMLKGAK
jgi:hypothetical protein